MAVDWMGMYQTARAAFGAVQEVVEGALDLRPGPEARKPTAIQSTCLSSATWSEGSGTVDVRFHKGSGKIYAFGGGTEDDLHRLVEAESPGRMINAWMRGSG